MAYGYMCAADVINPQLPGPGIGEEMSPKQGDVVKVVIKSTEVMLQKD
jgi:hypothetical protein